ncbi:nickel/cobalt transporter [Consotaella salsifontis]|uniref:Nickel/cobalt efflux system n=1 Tax=Consotaella salsifontis TaxID=1365950 RepID=A0A1T4NL24_9HYPH|nr:nickel/cobalt transporter [Consotaella salsifontis]SJZ79991.1 ABC-type nickel/cobalt efflux system, permease component RcnA [Consotaella salsifontis]
MRVRLLLALALLCVLAALEPALAKSSLGIGSADSSIDASGGVSRWFLWVTAYQREFFTALRHAIVGLKEGPQGMPLLVGVSFAYGIFHAAGPGHGKAVISSYMIANEVQLRRGVVLSFASALVQALSALLVVGAGWFVLRGTSISMTDASDALETASFGLIALFGAYLFAKKLVAIWRRRRPALAFSLAPNLMVEGAPALRAGGASGSSVRMMPAASGYYDAGVCTGEADCDCGRSHIADPASLGGRRLGLSAAASAVVSVGIRPCAGAIVVLTFALMNGLYAAGILSVLAMAVGTAITVSVLATLAVMAKDVALRMVGGTGFSGLVRDGLELAAAAVLMFFGLGFVLAMLSA